MDTVNPSPMPPLPDLEPARGIYGVMHLAYHPDQDRPYETLCTLHGERLSWREPRWAIEWIGNHLQDHEDELVPPVRE